MEVVPRTTDWEETSQISQIHLDSPQEDMKDSDSVKSL